MIELIKQGTIRDLNPHTRFEVVDVTNELLLVPFTRCLITIGGCQLFDQLSLIPYQNRTQNRLGIAVGIFIDKYKAPYEVGVEPTYDEYDPPALTT